MLNIYARSFMTATLTDHRADRASRHPEEALPRLRAAPGKTAGNRPMTARQAG